LGIFETFKVAQAKNVGFARGQSAEFNSQQFAQLDGNRCFDRPRFSVVHAGEIMRRRHDLPSPPTVQRAIHGEPTKHMRPVDVSATPPFLKRLQEYLLRNLFGISRVAEHAESCTEDGGGMFPNESFPRVCHVLLREKPEEALVRRLWPGAAPASHQLLSRTQSQDDY
jgi:hypothetical protein